MTAQTERTLALSGVQPAPDARPTRHQRRHSTAFWIVAAAFGVNLAFSAVPTPLYVIYQHRDHFSTLMITVVYAVYAVGVIASLFLGGHVSDWVGRRRVLVPALGFNVLSAVLFIAFPTLAGLIVARIVSGVSVGLTTGTATAYLTELHWGAGGSATGRRPQVVATAANLGGIGVGPLVAGLLAQFVPVAAGGAVPGLRRGPGRADAADRDRAGDGCPAGPAAALAPAAGSDTRAGPRRLLCRHRGRSGGVRRLRRLQFPDARLPGRDHARDVVRGRRGCRLLRVRGRGRRPDRARKGGHRHHAEGVGAGATGRPGALHGRDVAAEPARVRDRRDRHRRRRRARLPRLTGGGGQHGAARNLAPRRSRASSLVPTSGFPYR